jgi:hypothetical protein
MSNEHGLAERPASLGWSYRHNDASSADSSIVPACCSNVEADVNNIPILDEILFSLQVQQPLFARGRGRP